MQHAVGKKEFYEIEIKFVPFAKNRNKTTLKDSHAELHHVGVVIVVVVVVTLSGIITTPVWFLQSNESLSFAARIKTAQIMR